VPKGLQTISNGEPHGARTANGWTTYRWHAAKPQATYLTTLAIGRFEVHQGRTKSGLPVITAYSPDVDPALLKAAKASVETTPEVIDWESRVFGPYPFTSVGGYVPNVKSHFSLEEQTRVFYSPAAFSTGVRPYLIVHENAHQWFGDSVSLSTWRDIWLNEGFATYAEWLWSEKTGQGRSGNATTAQFEALSEKISGKDLRSLFQTWLYTTGRPAAPPAQVLPKSAPRSWTELRQTRALEALPRR
jgi:aminopeptidase N